MGVFSWSCEACKKSIRAPFAPAGVGKWMSKAVAVYKDGAIISGDYDGYGRINGATLDPNISAQPPFTIWHQACWNREGYQGSADDAKDQGYFTDQDENLPEPRRSSR